MTRLVRGHAQRRDGAGAVDLAGQTQNAVLRVVMVGQLAVDGFNAYILTAVVIQNLPRDLRARHPRGGRNLLPLGVGRGDLDLRVQRYNRADEDQYIRRIIIIKHGVPPVWFKRSVYAVNSESLCFSSVYDTQFSLHPQGVLHKNLFSARNLSSHCAVSFTKTTPSTICTESLSGKHGISSVTRSCSSFFVSLNRLIGYPITSSRYIQKVSPYVMA